MFHMKPLQNNKNIKNRIRQLQMKLGILVENRDAEWNALPKDYFNDAINKIIEELNQYRDKFPEYYI